MPQDRFFIDAPLSGEVILENDEAHHLFVMRKSVGDTIEIINGKNCLSLGTITHINKKKVHLAITNCQCFEPTSFPIILAQAIPKQNKLDFIIEKGTELGATTFWLFPGEKGEKKEVKDLERLKRIAISAMKQCGRLDLPEIIPIPPLLQLKELPFPAYFGDIESQPFHKLWKKEHGILIFIGPEAGFSAKEIEHLKKMGALGTKFHPHTLRTETAPLVALSLIQGFLSGGFIS